MFILFQEQCMKVAVSSTGDYIQSEVDQRFGRCKSFLIVDTDTMDFIIINNDIGNASGGAGINAAKIVSDAGAEVVLTGNCGPNAHRTLSASGIKLYTGVTGPIDEAINDLKNGKLTSGGKPTVDSHFGSGI
jgi:predicted Fe-Mo cluster-binding NifX family protein